MDTTLDIVSADGVVHPAVLAQPHARGAIVLCLPAMGAAAHYYQPFARELAKAGLLAALVDLRGQGRSSARARRGDDFGYREILELDLLQAVGDLRRRFPERPLVIAGHSLGGQLGFFFAARHAALVDGLALIAAGTAYWADWPTPAERAVFRVMAAGVRAVASLLPWYPGHRLGFGGEQPRRLMRDWGRVTREGTYRPEGSSFDYEGAAQALRLPIISIGIRLDPIAPASARRALVGRAPHSSVTVVEIDGNLADRRWKRHFSWARSPAEVARRIRDWMDTQVTPAVREAVSDTA